MRTTNGAITLVLSLVLGIGCGGSGSSSDGSEGSGGEDGAGSEGSGENGDASEDTGLSEGEEGEGDASGEVNPDSISNTLSEPTFTACEPPPPADCTDCGLRIALTRPRGWQEAEYRFEILAEGNHIRCAVTLPCQSTEPVTCHSSPGGPQVSVETAGCGGPLAGQSLVALRFAPNACPEEMRIESYRDTVRATVQDLSPRYQNGRASERHEMRR